MFNEAIENKSRFFLAALIVLLLAYLFWTGSRYPALDEKAMMSGAIQLEDPIGFEAKIQLTSDMGFAERVAVSTLNWINTNKKGMIFGLLFAAALMTLIASLRQRAFRSPWANSVLGMFIGAPLGVCVNCAAPIARGLKASGLRAETTLSAMIASPTLNIVVLTMAFSLLPAYIAGLKIGLSLLIILVIVPLVVRWGLPAPSIAPINTPPTEFFRAPEIDANESVLGSGLAVLKSYVANLVFIVKLTVPLMFLAGFLGALAGTLLPQDVLGSLPFSLGILVVVAAVGLFLPVPIAFDVVVTGALLSAGASHGYVMALLFTLGSFSIYSYFIVAQAFSFRIANAMAASVLVLGVASGAAVEKYHNWQSDRALDILLGAVPQIVAPAHAQSPDISVTARPFSKRSPEGATLFTRMEADQIGIDKPIEFSFKDMWPPFWEGRSLATADYDRDGDVDLAIASTSQALYLYENTGGSFSRVALSPGPFADRYVFNAGFADMDNDGWPDLILATYLDGNYLVRNIGGRFDLADAQPIPNQPDARLSLALAFDDADGDGDLDIAVGNWAAGWYRQVPGEESRNRVILNTGVETLGDTFVSLPGIPGETLSLLFSDINGDGAADLIEGNDFAVPDYIYLGDGKGGFAPVRKQDGTIPHTTQTTMAVKTADLANTGQTQLYFAQIAGRSSGVSDTLKMQPLARYCDEIVNPGAKAICARNMEIKTWYKSGNRFDPSYASRCAELPEPDRSECKGMLVKDIAIQRRDPKICDLIPANQEIAQAYCAVHFLPERLVTQNEIDSALPQIQRANVLLEPKNGTYTDTAAARGLDVGGWSWDTKIADFDNDGWQDVYIVNGTWVPNEVSPSNLFFHNRGDGSFSEASGPMGLEDYLMTAAATQFDFDNDGDLDIVTHSVNGPLIFFRNNAQDGNAIRVVLEDHQGNRDGIGARLTIHLADGKIQTREIQLGGGFMSFDVPSAHFGLGDADSVEVLHIRWRDGSESTLDGPLEAGHEYVVTRGAR
ncbi:MULTISPECIES: FG-GAP-like repeat-containing protein [unclassified Marinovum]